MGTPPELSLPRLRSRPPSDNRWSCPGRNRRSPGNCLPLLSSVFSPLPQGRPDSWGTERWAWMDQDHQPTTWKLLLQVVPARRSGHSKVTKPGATRTPRGRLWQLSSRIGMALAVPLTRIPGPFDLTHNEQVVQIASVLFPNSADDATETQTSDLHAQLIRTSLLCQPASAPTT
ncbi:hypothetical protein N658DRAFT_41164 [Parathielavia hyrcaniae]|uniref:Uncharacterized protein n=1 Tax=Parathielavia hyrcaniae TaxID=113614 RepID=A0AAN6Q1T3_9PEZI|nr:hypothetical protein N658DRAFT_41164 [Parathielavia hyrcaniae]